MPQTNNIIQFLPKTAAQANRIKKLARRDDLIDVDITVLPDRDKFREQRAWRILFGLYQDCASVPWSKGFKKTPGVAFTGKMRPSKLSPFLREAVPFVLERRAEIHINGERVRRRILEVMNA